MTVSVVTCITAWSGARWEGMNTPQDKVNLQQIREAELGWSTVGRTITATFATGDFATGLKLVNLIGSSAEEANHHPDIELTYPTVKVTLTSHDTGNITERDLQLAMVINGHADALGVDKAR